MNTVLTLFIFHFCVLCHGIGQIGRHEGGKPVNNPPRYQYSPVPSNQYSPAPSKVPVPHEYSKYNQPLGWDDNVELVQQRQLGNQEPHCPCVIRPGTNTCITYDLRYQASTLAEAMYGFPDLTLSTGFQKGASPQASIAGVNSWDCSTRECQLCASRMAQRLREVGLMTQSVPGLNVTVSPTSSADHCWGYRFDHPQRPTTPQPPRSSSAEDSVTKDINRLVQLGQENYQRNQMNGASSTQFQTSSNRTPGGSTNRGKRQNGSPSGAGILGTRFNISCVTKGEIDPTSDRMMSLCTSCWAWRQLPNNYFPQFINELICDTRDTSCLSGWATCNQGYRTLSVLRQQTNGTWEPVTIEAGSCCECKVQAGSALNNLVLGRGMSGSLNPAP